MAGNILFNSPPFNSAKYYSPSLVLAVRDLNLVGNNLPIECQQPRKLIAWIELDDYIDTTIKNLIAYEALLSDLTAPAYSQVYKIQAALNADFNNMKEVVGGLLANPYIVNTLRIDFLKSLQFTYSEAQIIEGQESNGILTAHYISNLLKAFQTFSPMIDSRLIAVIEETELKKFVTDLQNAITAIEQYQAAILLGTSTEDLLPFQANIAEWIFDIKTDTYHLLLNDSVGTNFYKFVTGVANSLVLVQSDIDTGSYVEVTVTTIVPLGQQSTIVSKILPPEHMNELLKDLKADNAYMMNILKGDVLDNMITGCIEAVVNDLYAYI